MTESTGVEVDEGRERRVPSTDGREEGAVERDAEEAEAECDMV